MIKKIMDMKDHKKYYDTWCYKVDNAYSKTLSSFEEIYDLKNQLDDELAIIYVEKLMDYYSHLKRLDLIYNVTKKEQTDEQRRENFNLIQNEVDLLISKYSSFNSFIIAIKDFNAYKNFGLPEHVLCFDEFV